MKGFLITLPLVPSRQGRGKLISPLPLRERVRVRGGVKEMMVKYEV